MVRNLDEKAQQKMTFGEVRVAKAVVAYDDHADKFLASKRQTKTDCNMPNMREDNDLSSSLELILLQNFTL